MWGARERGRSRTGCSRGPRNRGRSGRFFSAIPLFRYSAIPLFRVLSFFLHGQSFPLPLSVAAGQIRDVLEALGFEDARGNGGAATA